MAQSFSYDAWDDDLAAVRAAEDDSAHAAMFFPGERIGPPPPNRTLKALKRLLGMTALTAAVWGCWETRETWRPILESAQQPTKIEESLKSAQPDEAAAAPLPPLVAGKDVAEVAGSLSNPLGSPAAAATSAQASDRDAEAQPNETSAITPPAQPATLAPLPSPRVDIRDRKQKRAAAIGLHPGVSAVLLSSMSDADYRNAAEAIRKSLAETADNEKLIWPAKSSPKLARFQVHFVPSAGADCRRYVVTIVKNGWTTTAPPMEKCGIAQPNRRAVTALPVRTQSPLKSIE